MIMKEDTLKLFDYHQWANTQIFERLRALPEDVFHKELKSIFPTIENIVKHLVITDAIFLDVIRGHSFEHTQETIIPRITEAVNAKSTQEELEKLYQELYTDYKAELKSKDDLFEILDVRHPQAGPISISIADLVRQVVNHGTYHRGNIAAMIRQQGHKGVNTDYIAYLYQVK